MKIYHVAAVAKNGIIGADGDLPFHIPEDLARFKEITNTHTLIMGRKTFESLPCLLPGRHHVILSSKRNLSAKGLNLFTSDDGPTTQETDNAVVTLKNSIPDAYDFCEERDVNELYIIGGGEIYNQTLDDADELRLTIVHESVSGDTMYPSVGDNWIPSFVEEKGTHTYVDLIRRTNAKGYDNGLRD